MATYSVRTSRHGVLTGLANTTDVVQLYPTLSRQLAQRYKGWIRAIRNIDNTWQFFDAADHDLGAAIVLTRVDIITTVVGCEVLIVADGASRWEAGRVIKSGEEVLVGNAPLLGTTRAAELNDDVPQDVSAITGYLELGDVAEDGDQWFNQNGVPAVHCDAMTTLSALSAGAIAVVETSADKFEIVVL